MRSYEHGEHVVIEKVKVYMMDLSLQLYKHQLPDKLIAQRLHTQAPLGGVAGDHSSSHFFVAYLL